MAAIEHNVSTEEMALKECGAVTTGAGWWFCAACSARWN